MNSAEQNYPYYILVLKEFLGPYYPKEIIQLIIMATYQPIKIICGYYHTYLISDKIYVWGRNDEGQLGLGHYDNQNSPQEFTFFKRSDVIEISCGCNHMICLVKNNDFNKCYVWGDNSVGQLGLGDDNGRNLPLQIHRPHELILPGEIISIDCGYKHTITLIKINSLQKCYGSLKRNGPKEEFSLQGWGLNDQGQLGLGDFTNRTSPYELSLLNLMTVRCRGRHTIALSHSRKIYSWGHNNYGQLGLGDNNNRNLPQELNFHELIKFVDCGETHTIIMTINNKIYVWGNNYYGQLGLGHRACQNSPQELILLNIISISCGGDHTMALTSSGKIYGWGLNRYGQLGLSHNNTRDIPTEIFLQEQIISISCGYNHTMVVTNNNKVYVWGENNYGQLGLGDKTNRSTPQELIFKF